MYVLEAGDSMVSNICIFGDSVAKGVVLDQVQKKYTFLKDSFVRLISVKRGVQISNYSKFGCTVTKGLEMVRRHASELPKYDFIALEFGGNDCDYDWAQVASAPLAEHACKTPVEAFEQSYCEMVHFVSEHGGRPVMLTLPPIDSQRYFNWISRSLDGGNILTFLGDVDHIYRWQEMYNRIVLRLAHMLGVPLIDIRSAFLQGGDYRDYLCEDGIHPNSRGHLLITDAIDRALMRVS